MHKISEFIMMIKSCTKHKSIGIPEAHEYIKIVTEMLKFYTKTWKISTVSISDSISKVTQDIWTKSYWFICLWAYHLKIGRN